MLKRGLQSEIARRAGVTSQFVNQILSGTRRPSWNTAKNLAEASGTHPQLWLEGTPEQIRAALNQGDQYVADWKHRPVTNPFSGSAPF